MCGDCGSWGDGAGASLPECVGGAGTQGSHVVGQGLLRDSVSPALARGLMQVSLQHVSFLLCPWGPGRWSVWGTCEDETSLTLAGVSFVEKDTEGASQSVPG